MNLKTVIAAAVFTVAPALGHAQSQDPAATPGIDKRQVQQQQRIQQGVQSGALNQHEAARLERHQDRIATMEEKAKSDGVVTRNERARIQHNQNQESRRIHRQNHDRHRAQ